MRGKEKMISLAHQFRTIILMMYSSGQHPNKWLIHWDEIREGVLALAWIWAGVLLLVALAMDGFREAIIVIGILGVTLGILHRIGKNQK